MSQGTIPARQRRSQQTHKKLLAALEQLLKTKSFHDISVAEIGKVAGVSSATLYRRFKNKNALIPVLFDLQKRQMEQWVDSNHANIELGTISLKGALQRIARIAVRQLIEQRHIMKAISVLAHTRPELFGDEWQSREKRTLEIWKILIAHYENEITRTDKALAASSLAYFFNTIFVERIVFHDTSSNWGLDIDDEAFADEIADFAYGYLTANNQ